MTWLTPRCSFSLTLMLLSALVGCTTTQTDSNSAGQHAGDHAIGFYQDHVGHQWGFHCEFEPSCSEYGRQAVDEFGLLRGSLLIVDRLQRDHDLAYHLYSSTQDGRPLDPLAANAVFRATQSLEPALMDPLEGLLIESKPVMSEAASLAFAEQLFDERQWSWAALEYRQLLFHFPDTDHQLLIKRRLIQCYAALQRFGEALQLVDQLPAAEQSLWRSVLLRDSGRVRTAYESLAGDHETSQF